MFCHSLVFTFSLYPTERDLIRKEIEKPLSGRSSAVFVIRRFLGLFQQFTSLFEDNAVVNLKVSVNTMKKISYMREVFQKYPEKCTFQPFILLQ